MKISKSTIPIVVAFVTGLSPLAVIATQGYMEERRVEQAYKDGRIDASMLRDHGFFVHEDSWVRIVIPGLQISEEARTLLDIKFRAFYRALSRLVEQNRFEEMNAQQLHSVLTRNLNETVVSYSRDVLDAGVSQAFLDEFSKWHARTVNVLVRAIEEISFSPAFTDNNARIFSILSQYEVALAATIDDLALQLWAQDE
jgi:hypothetical protein